MKNDNKHYILGAICGDVIGSIYERNNVKSIVFPLFTKHSTFTDDSTLTFATMDALLNKRDFTYIYQAYAQEFPNRGYGKSFRKWMNSKDPEPYNSWGNGSAMRVSPVGWAFEELSEVLEIAKQSAEVTHNHPEGIKGAQATAAAVFMARKGHTKEEIKDYIQDSFGYDLERKINMIRQIYEFDVSCQGSVPEAIIAFLEGEDYESTIRLAISIGGDSDTIACIAGAIAEAFYKEIPDEIVEKTLERLPVSVIALIAAFSDKFGR